MNLDDARRAQQALDDAIWDRIPEPEVREISFEELTRSQRTLLGDAWADTEATPCL